MNSSKLVRCHQLVFTVAFCWLLAACGGDTSGSPSVSVPSVVGMTQAAATTTIIAAKLIVGTVTTASSATVASGSVISETPTASSSVAAGSAVNLTVSSGPPPVAVPNVVGTTQSAATTAITGAGLIVGTVTTTSSTSVPSGSVISESPAAGTSVASGSAVNLTISSGAAIQHFAYVPNAGSGTISAYSVDSTTGALTGLAGSPITVPGAAQLYEAKIDASGKFLYVVDNSATGAKDVYAFSINASTGSLTAVAGSPFAGGNLPQSIAFDASGAYLYVANVADNSISAYSISPTTGVLTQLTGSPYPISGSNPSPNQIVRAGNYLYVANYNTNSVDVFAINAGTGALTEGVPGSPFATDTQPFSLVVDHSGAVLYTANVGASSSGSISAFTINSSTGVLSPVAGNPLAIHATNYLAIDPQSKFLFVTESSGVAVYPIDATTGVLGAAAVGSPFATGSNSYSVTVNSTGQFVYVGNDGSANVSEFSLAGTGVLTAIVGSPVSAGTNPDFIAIE